MSLGNGKLGLYYVTPYFKQLDVIGSKVKIEDLFYDLAIFLAHILM